MTPEPRTRPRSRRLAALGGGLLLALAVIAASAAWLTAKSAPTTTNAGSPAALAADHVRVCGNRSVLGRGPSARPAGAVSVPAGDDSRINFRTPHATYWFAPGIHTLGAGRFAQIQPGAGSTFIGAPGAVLDGRRVNYYAFTGTAPDVRIRYLTIENFGSLGGDFNQGVVNASSAAGWTIDHTTIEDNAGAGVMLGSRDTLRYDCLLKNQQYGFNAYAVPGPDALTLDDNEIAENDTYNWEQHTPGCGCSGGGKFWNVDGASVEGNWVHGNHNVGLWADTNNRGFNFSGNYFDNNYAEALIYEISYNAQIKDNLFVRNAIGAGPSSPGFPTPAIYISESGSDRRVATSYSTSFQISHNVFIDNWSGVILWENSNRFCGSPDNSSSGTCTLVDPSVANIRTCTRSALQHATASQTPDYYDLCRWKTQNVDVDDNHFSFDPAAIGPDCSAARGCGYVGVFSEYGSDPSWSPYQGTAVEYHITLGQDNHFTDNVYDGPWKFMALADGETVSWSLWRSRYGQDAGSALATARP
ncbi:MAG TPA: right-handed parallel beta-helix repeat-containing protein [Streptosporangiaceae bacterium]|nr:right-handed parallel beta-helix repeat-containing protein [Streptosporangiaceae bacterium]